MNDKVKELLYIWIREFAKIDNVEPLYTAAARLAKDAYALGLSECIIINQDVELKPNVVDGINSWMLRWARQNWIRSSASKGGTKDEIMNKDLWMDIWLSSDPHFYHEKVIDYCKRPFSSVDHMNEELISNFNECVQNDDWLIFLGDMVFGGVEKTKSILSRLNGRKKLILGNHDRQHTATKWQTLGFEIVKHSDEIQIGDEKVLLSHFPYRGLESDDRVFHEQLRNEGHWLCHGHVHCHHKVKDKMINVGVDVWDFKPVHISEIIQIIQSLQMMPLH